MDAYHELAAALVSLVGGRGNIVDVTHCATRLRFILGDEGLADTTSIEALPEVVAVVRSGGQYQVVIGTQVPDVYEAVVAELAVDASDLPEVERDAADEGGASDGRASGIDPKRALGVVSAFLANCMQPLIPMMAAVGMVRTLAMVLGPDMLGVLGAEATTLSILTLVGDVGIAALPVFIAWSSSGYLGTNTVLALFCGVFLASPGLAGLLGSGEAVKLFGIPVPAVTYTSQVVPVMLVMVAMHFVERGLKRLLSQDAQFMVMPILEILIMLPLMLCFVGPLGTWLGGLIAEGVLALHAVAGPLGVAVIGSVFILLCATGLHTALIATAFTLIEAQGYDSVAMVGAGAAAYACFGLYLAYTLFEPDKRQRQVGLSALLTHAVGGVAEPGMFSLMLTHAHLMAIEMASAFLGSLYLGLTQVALYTPGVSNFMAVMQFVGGDDANFRNAAIGCAISFVSSFALCTVMLLRARQSADR